MSVNIENMRTLVRRLRDPEARQARDVLRDEDGAMCCLGHANDVSGLGKWVDGDIYVVDGKPRTSVLHPDVVEWLGVDEEDPELVIESGVSATAASLNDVHGYTLAEIADCIERTWPEVRDEGAVVSVNVSLIRRAAEPRSARCMIELGGRIEVLSYFDAADLVDRLNRVLDAIALDAERAPDESGVES